LQALSALTNSESGYSGLKTRIKIILFHVQNNHRTSQMAFLPTVYFKGQFYSEQ